MQVLHCWAKLELQSGSQLNRLFNSNFDQQYSTTTAAYSAGYSVHTYTTCHKTQLSFPIYQLIKVFQLLCDDMMMYLWFFLLSWNWTHFNLDMFLNGAGLMDLIPRSCQFPPDVQHITQMLNMENLQKAEMSAGLVKSDCGG